ncbi:unnamed protein product [Darwinula stevensoni]|uniref:DUSP domain-containing protein n=1 Tax=Darwinula stevensoni TaxID=69355 RepID=A0A7R9ADQ9_9CRUS|nr:unnamed protein product [Darwinula stevensoni]CAG0901325.1 unnamed protein product [Darwinula stevensoni]
MNAERSTEHPGPIDNSSLLVEEDGEELRERLIEDLDFVMVLKDVWMMLVEWYGLVPNRQPIPRQVIEQEYGDLEKNVIHKFSWHTTVAQLEFEMRNLFNGPASRETRVLFRDGTDVYTCLNLKDDTLEDLGITSHTNGQPVVLEVKCWDGS